MARNLTHRNKYFYAVAALLFIAAVLVLAGTHFFKTDNEEDEAIQTVIGYHDAQAIYGCSHTIKVKPQVFHIPGNDHATGAVPVDPALAKKYCHMTAAF
jgi:hypothetical protein